ncbi:MAG: hypothetical protein WC785_05385 [Tatlockia sp.]|jgi:hypothetical protein
MIHYIRLIDSAFFYPDKKRENSVSTLINLLSAVMAIFQANPQKTVRPAFELTLCHTFLTQAECDLMEELAARYFFLLQQMESMGIADEKDFQPLEQWLHRAPEEVSLFLYYLAYLGSVQLDPFFDLLVEALCNLSITSSDIFYIETLANFLLHFQCEEVIKNWCEQLKRESLHSFVWTIENAITQNKALLEKFPELGNKKDGNSLIVCPKHRFNQFGIKQKKLQRFMEKKLKDKLSPVEIFSVSHQSGALPDGSLASYVIALAAYSMQKYNQEFLQEGIDYFDDNEHPINEFSNEFHYFGRNYLLNVKAACENKPKDSRHGGLLIEREFTHFCNAVLLSVYDNWTLPQQYNPCLPLVFTSLASSVPDALNRAFIQKFSEEFSDERFSFEEWLLQYLFPVFLWTELTKENAFSQIKYGLEQDRDYCFSMLVALNDLPEIEMAFIRLIHAKFAKDMAADLPRSWNFLKSIFLKKLFFIELTTENASQSAIRLLEESNTFYQFIEASELYSINQIVTYLVDDKDKKLSEQAFGFVRHFHLVNQKNNQLYDEIYYFNTHKPIMDLLVLIMGPQAFYFMKKLIVQSVMPLINYLNLFHGPNPLTKNHEKVVVSLSNDTLEKMQKLFKYHEKNILSNASAYLLFKEILLQWSVLALIQLEHPKLLTERDISMRTMQLFSDTNSLEDNNKGLNILLSELFFEIMGWSYTLQNNKNPVLNQMTNAQIPRIFIAMFRMKENVFNSYFINILKKHLVNVYENKEKIKDIELFIHNQGIINKLCRVGINVEKLKCYDKKMRFKYHSNELGDVEKKINAIIASYRAFKEALTDCIPPVDKRKKLILDLTVSLDKYEKIVKDGNDYDAIKKSLIVERSIAGHVDKMANKLKHIEEQCAKEFPIATLLQHGKDFIRHYTAFKKDLNTINNPQKILNNSTRYFRVERWNKDQLQTLFLGDMLSCCLASDGTRFPAIIQRYKDAGMFMDVVIDEKTGLPVCGNWLFWGEDAFEPEKVYAVANFFEIHSSIASKPLLLKTLVDHLLYFSGEYAREVGAAGFLLRPLTYGAIPDFTQFGNTIPLSLKKTGGCCGQFESRELKNLLKKFQVTFNDLDGKFKGLHLFTGLGFFDEVPLIKGLKEIRYAIAALQTADDSQILQKYDALKTIVSQFSKENDITQDKKINSIVSRIKNLIKNHEAIMRFNHSSLYFLESLNVKAFYLYQPEAMEQSEVFNPDCQVESDRALSLGFSP